MLLILRFLCVQTFSRVFRTCRKISKTMLHIRNVAKAQNYRVRFFPQNNSSCSYCVIFLDWTGRKIKMVNGSRYYRALESISIASALSSALTIYPCQIRVHQCWQSKLPTFLQLWRRSGGWPQRTVHPRRLPVDTVIHTTLVGLEPATFRLLVQRTTSNATNSLPPYSTFPAYSVKTQACILVRARGAHAWCGVSWHPLVCDNNKLAKVNNNTLIKWQQNSP